ncbi:hypothetical protein PMKS-003456 [Pichia membranifaciens]|uniref:Uncharacterized protein n=1 Tax=Pichia membranifaciens TaxID=4926 RepID=A0A1Q2YK84_9ASCO|nr:hypothetical protein PMKS-003456 [Pichia membranifaciens]
MSQADKLQYILSSKDFMANMAAGLLMQKDAAIMGDEDVDLDSELMGDFPGAGQSISSIADSNMNFLTSFSKEEKLEIQKKLSIYDHTLKDTLDAIKSGKVKNEQALQPLFQNSPIDTDMSQLLKSFNSSRVKKLKVNDDISVSIQTTSDPQGTEENPHPSLYETKTKKAADQYTEQMIKIINHHKKFDNFLDEVQQIEDTSDKSKGAEKSGEYDPSNQDESCKLTLEYDRNGNLIHTGNEDALKSKINAQIVKALESLKLDYNLEEDIAGAIAKSFENNHHLLPKTEESSSESRAASDKKGLSIDTFTSQLEQYKERYMQQLEGLSSSAEFESYVSKTNQHPVQNSSEHVHSQQSESQHTRQQHAQNKKEDQEIADLKGQIRHVKHSKLSRNGLENPKLEYYSDPTPEQRQKLRRECMEKLRMQDLQLNEEVSKKSKRKKNKKKKNPSSSLASNGLGHTYISNSQSDAWLCELCEYKIVYGEVPVFLTEWLQKKANHHEKMETYQRYLLEQKKGRKLQQNKTHPECQNINHQHDHDGGCSHTHMHNHHFEQHHDDCHPHMESLSAHESLSLPPPPPPPPSNSINW